jgi:soluble lytic murein transglycosylase
LKRTKNITTTVIVILVLSVLIGFLADAVITRVEKQIYPLKYNDIVKKYADLYGVPEQIIYATIKVESDFQSDAVSSAGAIGLMQITPDTFEWIQMILREKLDDGLLYDPETNIKYGTFLLSYLYSEFGNWENTHAAYNAGMSRVKQWLEDDEYSKNGVLYNIPYKETRAYVKKIANAGEIYLRLYY